MRSRSTAERLGILYLDGVTIKVDQEPMDVISVSVFAHRRRSRILSSPSLGQTLATVAPSQLMLAHSLLDKCLCSAENVETFGTLSLFTGVSAYA